MIKQLSIAILLLGFTASAVAQLYPYKWRIGVSAGYATYYGDVSPYQIDEFGDIAKVFRWFDYNPNYIPQPSVALSLETRLSPTLGLALKGGYYSFAMSDRFIDRSGDLQTDSRNFNRALNFKTDLTDVGLALVFRTDNGKLLNRKALVAPYLSLGAGVLWFNVYGDLYDASGQRYDYATNSIVVDGNYETNLQPLRTETSNGYDNWAFYGELSLGIRFRLAHRWEAFIQSDLKYTTTDYIDDVSGRYRSSYVSQEQQYAANPTNLPEAGNYRGNPNNVNDAFFYHSVGIKFSFAHAKEDFTAPVIYGQGWSDAELPDPPDNPEEALPTKTGEVERTEENYDEVTMNESLREELEPTMQWLENELAIVQIREREEALARRQDSLEQVHAQLMEDNSELRSQLDTLPEDSATMADLREQEMRADSLAASLDSLKAERTFMKEEHQSLDSALTAQKQILETETIATDTTVVQDTVRTVVKKQQTDTLVVKESITKTQPTDQMLYDLMERQAVRDSLIIARLTDLLDTPRSENTSPQPQQRDYQADETIDTYEAPESTSEVSAGDLESLRMEVEFLRDQLNRSSDYPESRDYSNLSPNVVVVPSGGGGRDTVYQYDERQAAENQQLRSELQQIRAEMEEMRKDMRARDYRIEKYLKEEEAQSTPKEQLADSAAADTLVPPPAPIKTEIDTLEKDSIPLPVDSILTDTSISRTDTLLVDTVTTSDENVPSVSDTTSVEQEAPPAEEPLEESVYFALNSVTPSAKEVAKLEKIAAFWKSHPDYRIHLISYADNTGNPEYNRQLCARRNEAVKKVLVDEFGVDADKIKTEVGGKIVRNGKAWNPDDRRVDITVKATE